MSEAAAPNGKTSWLRLVSPHLRRHARQSYFEGEKPGQALDCSLGTNPFGPSPRVAAAARSFAWPNLGSYPPYPYVSLRRALATYWSRVAPVDEDAFVVGVGSFGILSTLNRLLLRPGVNVVGYRPQFADYVSEIPAWGARYVSVSLDPQNGLALDPEVVLTSLDRKTAMVYVDHPNNPTGQAWDKEALRVIARETATRGALLVVDEAYGDLIPAEESALSFAAEFDNVVVTRSFSKGFGLAGARVGYGYLPPWLRRIFREVEMLFEVNTLGVALAEAALADRDYVARCMVSFRQGKQLVARSLKSLQMMATHPTTSIFLLRAPSPAVDLPDALRKKGVIACNGKSFPGLDQSYARLRLPQEMDALARILGELDAQFEVENG